MGTKGIKIDELLVIIFVLIVIIILACVVGVRISRFHYELRYLNIELGRCSNEDRSKWLRRRRNLWLNLFFPFYEK
ncbi:MAG: hypothetical protein IKC95_02335 [Oscillospiraceae bacterium]|nr:hypothetical protein [Oscillospiraceae bacterium]